MDRHPEPAARNRQRGLSFTYRDGDPAGSPGVARVDEVRVKPVRGIVYVYATVDPVNRRSPSRPDDAARGPSGCIAHSDGDAGEQPAPTGSSERDAQAQELLPEGTRLLGAVGIGERAGDKLRLAAWFGLCDDSRATGRPYPVIWLWDGLLNRFGPYARPDTPFDFKVRLDLSNQRITAWVAGRGDDRWFLLAEDVVLPTATGEVNCLRIEHRPGGPDIAGLRVSDGVWPPGERIRPHPLAKRDRIVRPGAGFTFQPMRSSWRKPGAHVTIFRKQGVHSGFPDVTWAGADHLVCVWRNGSHTGGTGGLSLAHSYDLGRSWSEPTLVSRVSANCPRIQRLRDDTLLLLTDIFPPGGGPQEDATWDVVLWDSLDGGHTWTNERWLTPAEIGAPASIVPGRVTELADGSWLLGASSFPKTPHGGWAEKIEIYRSTDRGQTWAYWAGPMAYPPHCLSEPSIIALADGRLLLYARESRIDGMPGAKAYSDDGGRSWTFQELPHPITGRTCAGLLRDGRVFLTFRSSTGPAALRAWIGDVDDSTTSQPAGAHFNDRLSVGLAGGALHIDNDGVRGQFTRYSLRPPDTPKATVEVTAEVKALSNAARAATLAVPFAGKLRIFPDHAEMAHDPSLRVDVAPGEFHTYHMVSRIGALRIEVDGLVALETDRGDSRLRRLPWTEVSLYDLGFGNEAEGSRTTEVEGHSSELDIFLDQIDPEVTGCSIWRSVEADIDDPGAGRHHLSWFAARDGFPDRYQLSHIIEVEASINSCDQGYSGWVELDDGRIFVVNYTDDTAPSCVPESHMLGVPWIRGTFLKRSDLPARSASTRARRRGGASVHIPRLRDIGADTPYLDFS